MNKETIKAQFELEFELGEGIKTTDSEYTIALKENTCEIIRLLGALEKLGVKVTCTEERIEGIISHLK